MGILFKNSICSGSENFGRSLLNQIRWSGPIHQLSFLPFILLGFGRDAFAGPGEEVILVNIDLRDENSFGKN